MQLSVTLSDSDILSLPTTAFPIIPAPGAGKFIRIINALFKVDTTGGAYTNVGAGQNCLINLEYNNAFDASNYSLGNGVVDNGAVSVSLVEPVTYVNGTINENARTSPAVLENQPIVLTGFNSLGNFTGGNAANTFKVVVNYSIENMP